MTSPPQPPSPLSPRKKKQKVSQLLERFGSPEFFDAAALGPVVEARMERGKAESGEGVDIRVLRLFRCFNDWVMKYVLRFCI